VRGALTVLAPLGEPPEELDDGAARPEGDEHSGRKAVPDAPGERPALTSRHGKELLASHRLPAHGPPPRTWKPLLAGVLLIVVAGGGFLFSGIYIAIPESPWVSGERGEIFGNVYHKLDQNDTPVPNATVSVGGRSVQTNETGFFDLKGVDTGRQVIVVEAPGYRQLRWRTVITGGNPLGYRFILSAGNGTEEHDDVGGLNDGFYACGSVIMALAAIVLAGALFCFRRTRYSLAATGAFLSFLVGYFQVFFLYGVVMPLGIILSLASVILLLFSRGEFT